MCLGAGEGIHPSPARQSLAVRALELGGEAEAGAMALLCEAGLRRAPRTAFSSLTRKKWCQEAQGWGSAGLQGPRSVHPILPHAYTPSVGICPWCAHPPAEAVLACPLPQSQQPGALQA